MEKSIDEQFHALHADINVLSDPQFLPTRELDNDDGDDDSSSSEESDAYVDDGPDEPDEAMKDAVPELEGIDNNEEEINQDDLVQQTRGGRRQMHPNELQQATSLEEVVAKLTKNWDLEVFQRTNDYILGLERNIENGLNSRSSVFRYEVGICGYE